jgi:hypothetical protein
VLTWNQIAETLAAAAGCTADIVHVPSDEIAAADPEWGAGLLGGKAHSLVFDNSKLRSVVPGYRAVIPFEQGPGRSSAGTTRTRRGSRPTCGWARSWTSW